MALKLGPDVHQPVWLRIRQWCQQRRVGHGEDRRGGADAKREREQYRASQTKAFAQRTKGIGEVLKQALHERKTVLTVTGSFKATTVDS